MASEVHVKETDEHHTVIGQERPPVEEPPVPMSGVKESRQEETSPAVPSVAAPTPPSGRLAASIQRMPPTGRRTLGLALAFLSSFAFVLLSSIPIPSTAMVIPFVVMIGLALAAGYVLSSWWALLALVGASAAGGLVGSWVVVQMLPAGSGEGVTGMAAALVLITFFAILELGPLIVLLLAGVCFGKLQGIALGQSHALSAGHARVIRWIAALGPVVAAGYLVTPSHNLYGIDVTPVLIILPIFLYATVLAAPCLLAGWLLRSWWGLVVAPVVYVGVAIVKQAFLGGGVSDWPTAIVTFVLIIVLPAVVMSAIGTAIGKYRAR